MAIYKPDYKLQEAIKIIKSLDTKDHRDEHIKYYISNMEKNMKNKDTEIKKYKDFFETLSSFLPFKKLNPTIRG